ncbi:TRAF3-interacting protein 1 isoform X2 [Ceratina calcarata]|uniref:TRAF3-interacting protein 1 n=1 Tax=Ceratina calcarata TaxID=156304 RepID=A0AAJ7WCF7_9HYME|nr:TRAF3-interacting protein 1 isoform X2 [Ceratina calcarata]
MADDVKPEVIKRTQDLLGKYFKKPPLTEKLLKKPPFRFLHDIISAVINNTGFLDGLYSEEELNSENIKTKEAKLAYLTKLIEVVELTTGDNLTVRASKIISGQEPSKTNELLQAIGRALDKKISSTEAIEQYKMGVRKDKSSSRSKSVAKDEKKSLSKDAVQNRRVKEKSTERSTDRTGKGRSTERLPTAKERSTEGNATKEKSDTKKGHSNEDNSTRDETRKHENQEPQKNTDTPEIRQVERPPTRERAPSSSRKRRSSASRSKQNLSSEPNLLELDKKTDESKKQKESENKSKRAVNQSSESRIRTSSVDPTNLESESPSILKNNTANETAENVEYKQNDDIANNEVIPNVEKAERSVTDMQGFHSEGSDTSISSRPRTSLRPPSARPISARPAAPRIRGKPEMMVNEEILTPLGNITVIVENSDLKDDDAEDMVVMETRGNGSDDFETGSYKVDDQLTQEHGHLVAQILETQKELVNNDNVDVIPKKTNISWDTSAKRDVVAKEIDKLRNTIQTLTRATNPLGKLLDYFQEDVEIMQKELFEWRNQYQLLNEELKIEKTKTQELIEPMKETLKEIDRNMKIQLDKICQAKSQIMKNDQRIQTLLNGSI